LKFNLRRSTLAAIVASLCLSAVSHILHGPVALAAALQTAARWPWAARNFAMLLAAGAYTRPLFSST